jgi:uncharacterized protein (DUF58 family)
MPIDNTLRRSHMARAITDGELAGSRYQLAVPRHVPTGHAGAHLSRAAGASLEFKDHREYQPGDDLRFIDWSAFARSDRLTVKLYREETSPHLDVLLDGSRSMALADTAKAAGALGLTAALVTAARNARFSHNVFVAADRCLPMPQGTLTPAAWEAIDFDGAAPLAEALHAAPPAWRPRGVRIVISDLLFLADPMHTVELLAHGATSLHVIQLLADDDVDPPQRGNIRLVDCETHEAREVFIDAAAEKRYRNNLARHQQHWHDAARKVGATMTSIVAESLLRDYDLGELMSNGVLQVA